MIMNGVSLLHKKVSGKSVEQHIRMQMQKKRTAIIWLKLAMQQDIILHVSVNKENLLHNIINTCQN